MGIFTKSTDIQLDVQVWIWPNSWGPEASVQLEIPAQIFRWLILHTVGELEVKIFPEAQKHYSMERMENPTMPVSNTSDLYLKVYSLTYKDTNSIIQQKKSQAEHND